MALLKRTSIGQLGRWQPLWLLGTAVILGLIISQLPLPIAVGVVGGTAVLLLIVIQPLFGLAIALLLGPFGALENVVFGPSLFDSGQIALIVTIGVWMARSLSRRRLNISRTFLLLPFAAFIFVMGLTLLQARSLTFGFRELIKWLEMAAIMLMVVDLGNELLERQKHKQAWMVLLGMLLLTGLLQAGIGIWQFGLRGHGPEHFIILGQFYRAYGTFEQPNPFGGFMHLTGLLAVGTSLGLVSMVGLRWWGKRGGVTQSFTEDTRSFTEKSREEGYAFFAPSLVIFIFVSVAAMVLALLLSWSRGAWLSFGVGTAVLIFFWPRNRKVGFLMVGLGIIGLLVLLQFNLIPASVTERLVSFTQDLRFGDVRGADINDANYAVLERLAHWQAALDMFRHQIWLGVGFGNYEPAYAEYALINWPDPLGHAHNYYLNLLAETGVLGLMAYVGFWTAVFWQTIRALRQNNWFLRGMVLGLLAAWVALAVHHLTDKLYVNNIYVHLGVMLGLLQLLDLERDWGIERVGD
ncbi:MAG: O-antigen ligase domain-containing protein [Chloroflexi bacterium]|nr:MAG: O-antigen ligase domain-containing protein [Chloroflexota bacterium]